MIHLLPYYQSLNNEIHSETRDHNNAISNKKYSLSVLNSVLPAMVEYAVENSDKCVLIATPSKEESQLIVSYFIRQIGKGKVPGFSDLNVVKYFDLKPHKLMKEPGIYIACYNAVVEHVVACDTVIAYYQYSFPFLQRLYGLADTLAVFDPVNKNGNWYAEFIQQILRKENGVRK